MSLRSFVSGGVQWPRLRISLYRGLASATVVPPPPSDWKAPRSLTNEHVERAATRDASLRAAYDRAPGEFVAHAHPPSGPPIDAATASRKRLLYRSRQRGWLEVDLLLGAWAAKYLPTLPEGDLAAYEAILNLETLDIYNLITGVTSPPPELRGPVLDGILTFVRSNPLGKASVKGYEDVKRTMSN